MTAELLDPVTKAEYYYDYAGDDPINNIDPNGLSTCSFILGNGICRAAHYVGSELGSSFSDFGTVAAGFIIGEGSCYIAAEALGGIELGPAGIVGSAIVCAAGGAVLVHDIQRHLRTSGG